MLEDIAILTGGKVVSEEVGLKIDEVGPEVLGRAKTIKISKEETTIIDGAGNPKEVKERIAQIKAELNNPSTSKYDREKLEERLAKFVGGVAVVNVGAATETELKEKKRASKMPCMPHVLLLLKELFLAEEWLFCVL